MNSTMSGGRGLCAGHGGTDAKCQNIYHENIFVENNTITGVANEGCALFNVYNAQITNNTIRATGGSTSKVSSCALHVQIPYESTAPSGMTSTMIYIANNKCYGGRNGIVVCSHSKTRSKFGKVYILNNRVWYRGTEANAIATNGWDDNLKISWNAITTLYESGNILKKGW